jgi:hypothetical protein
MNDIKKCIDSGLSDMKLSPDFAKRIENSKKPGGTFSGHGYRIRYGVLTAVLCILLFGTAAFAAGSLLYSKIRVNQAAIPDLDPMEITAVNPVEGTVTEYGDVEKTYVSFRELEEELGIKLLDTDLASENPFAKISYRKLGEGYHVIDIQEYILGDVTDIREWKGEPIDNTREGNDEWYVWTQGAVYKTPVDLKIEIISDPSQQELDTEYMGCYKYVETFTSQQGYTVNVLRDTIAEEQTALPEGYTPQTLMIFAAEGIRYTLEGRIPPETMKEIVSSMK